MIRDRYIVASLHPQVSHISAFTSERQLEVEDSKRLSADDVFDSTTLNTTDQNAFTQTGCLLTTPYTDIGLDGSNYVLGKPFASCCCLCSSIMP